MVTRLSLLRICLIASGLAAALISPVNLLAQDDDELTSQKVIDSIERAKRFLVSQQAGDGSWSAGNVARYQVGVTSLALMALINGGMTVDEQPVRKGLEYLRTSKEAKEVSMTYEVSLMIMALAAAKDGNRDKTLILTLARKLEDGQITRGDNAGSWTYGVSGGLDLGGDRSNGQFAILGLREASDAGIPIERQVWERARKHWLLSQNGDGGWGYSGIGDASTGSMTVAGIATIAITDAMLQDDKDLNPDGTPRCCTNRDADKSLDRGIDWLARQFPRPDQTIAGHNPGNGSWLLYYLYGMERAGRLSGRRFIGSHDWYREGAKFLTSRQSLRFGGWSGVGGMEANPVVGTSFALLFLSKGLSPVLINKLKYDSVDPVDAGKPSPDDWNQHPHDIRNITDLITGLPKWPKLVTWQLADLAKIIEHGSVADLLQSPILYISGRDTPKFGERETAMLRSYVDQGGFILAVNNCNGAGFDDGFRNTIRQMYPGGEAQLKRLPADHPVFVAEYPLDPESVELYGVDFGCRTGIIYSPDDLSCYWDRWMRYDPPKRPQNLKTGIVRSTNIGVNIIAYATGREPPDKLTRHELVAQDGAQDRIERGFLQIAKLRHTGGWDAAPQALRNLLLALNRAAGTTASTKQRDLPATDPNLFKYPLLYMHGRNRFQMNQQERENLRQYLSRGGVMFADACCGSSQFDESFREVMSQLFPNHELKRIPPDHEMFSSTVGYDLRTVKRRAPAAPNNPKVALDTLVQEGEPFLEGIELDGRYAVIYSKYDISCALERQASVACSGYVADDALRLAVNIVRYALLQDVAFSSLVK